MAEQKPKSKPKNAIDKLTSKAPMAIARDILKKIVPDKDRFGKSVQYVYYYHGNFWQWWGDRWLYCDEREMEDRVRRLLEHAKYCSARTDDGTKIYTDYEPTISKCREVVAALRSVVMLPELYAPAWLMEQSEDGKRKAPLTSEKRSIAFKDVVLDIDAMSQGESNYMVQRDRRWFDLGFVPARYNPGAECPLWKQCIETWGLKDPLWETLLKRWFGYCLMAERSFAKMLLMIGPTRSGKGTVVGVLRQLVGPQTFKGLSVRDLVHPHGLEGLEVARVIDVPEMSELSRREADTATRVLKNILGEDPISINPKGKRVMHNMVIGAAPLMQTNEIPAITDKAGGMSSKLVVLKMMQKLVGREDFDLQTKLRSEIPGIAAWAVDGAVELLRAYHAGEEMFPMTEAAKAEFSDYQTTVNPVDAFLNDCFVPSGKGSVTVKYLVRTFFGWKQRTGSKIYLGHRNWVAKRIIEGSSWKLTPWRNERARYVFGLAPRKNMLTESGPDPAEAPETPVADDDAA